MLVKSTIGFLKDLKKNNNKTWFDENRKTYEAAKEDMEKFVQAVIDTHAKNDPSISALKAKECLFRINRDVRFSKDKSPYKTNFGASINAGGKKSMRAGYYIHIEPGQSFTGGGLYMPMPPDLKKVRQEIDYNLEEFRSIVEGKKFKSVFGKLSESADLKLTRVPQGFEKDSPAAEYLVFKSFVAIKQIPDSDLQDKTMVKKVTEAFTTLQPLLNFLNRSFD
ncbi:DUF2461 domain-containing protein [Flavihumibacter profundi]|uniref:DUF2461 domain-containing protein n=1 Tax=Flavihumibacter profundi TaxID=2716883 RepID=UPI001CC54CCC|nr:DUF2461 domain-containing protein [Flavihumibacter profundi]MBZ5858743.1 DUF2461 domain-containing protein [Flavihumibacter profundi]